jgi:hypothetical protein
MNRLVPLIERAPIRSGPARFAAIDAYGGLSDLAGSQDLRLFVTAFVGGLIFFGTFFG